MMCGSPTPFSYWKFQANTLFIKKMAFYRVILRRWHALSPGEFRRLDERGKFPVTAAFYIKRIKLQFVQKETTSLGTFWNGWHLLLTEAWHNQKAFLSIHRNEKKNALQIPCFVLQYYSSLWKVLPFWELNFPTMLNVFVTLEINIEFMVDNFCCNWMLAVNHLRWWEKLRDLKLC